MKEIILLNVRLDNLTNQQLQKQLNQYLNSSSTHLITTVNPEFTLVAQKNESFLKLLNQADLSLPDGFGLVLAALTYGQKLIRHTGADLTIDLIQQAEKNNWPIAIINWSKGLSPAPILQPALEQKYPQLKFIIEDIDRGSDLNNQQKSRLISFQPMIVFCSLGAPEQEFLLQKYQQAWSNTRILIGIGGSFDFAIDQVQRAPKLWRYCGLEWLWRLIQQPQRWPRIWQAVVVFSWQFLIWRFFTKKTKNRPD